MAAEWDLIRKTYQAMQEAEARYFEMLREIIEEIPPPSGEQGAVIEEMARARAAFYAAADPIVRRGR